MAKISPVTGRYVTIEVDDLEYRVFWLENGEGPALVCQHTAATHNHQYRHLLEDEDFTSRYRIIAYDMARHGKSDPPRNAEWWKEDYRLTADHLTIFCLQDSTQVVLQLNQCVQVDVEVLEAHFSRVSRNVRLHDC